MPLPSLAALTTTWLMLQTMTDVNKIADEQHTIKYMQHMHRFVNAANNEMPIR
jgi:hypothetical protein